MNKEEFDEFLLINPLFKTAPLGVAHQAAEWYYQLMYMTIRTKEVNLMIDSVNEQARIESTNRTALLQELDSLIVDLEKKCLGQN